MVSRRHAGWDNTPRRLGRRRCTFILRRAAYEAWLSETVAQALGQPGQAPLVFVNSWNEWAEGAH